MLTGLALQYLIIAVRFFSGIWGLKKNFALLELLERLQVNKEPVVFTELVREDISTSITECDEDDSHVAQLYCTVCLTNLCESCFNNIHKSKTLSQHSQVPISEKPKINPPCQLHRSHVLEFACLEESCRDNPLMCYICKDYGSHEGHKHVLLENEAERIRKSILNAVHHVKTFSGEIAEFARKLSKITEKIEGWLVSLHTVFTLFYRCQYEPESSELCFEMSSSLLCIIT